MHLTSTRAPADPEADPRVQAVFDGIRATRKTTALQVPVDTTFDAG